MLMVCQRSPTGGGYGQDRHASRLRVTIAGSSDEAYSQH